MVTHTISVTELVWTLFCLVGFFYNLRILRRALGDLFDLKKRKINSIREYAARLTVFVYGMLTFVQFVFSLMGLLAMLIPPTSGTTAVNSLQLLLTLGFLTVSAVMALGAFINERGRIALVNKIREIEDMGH